MLARHLDWYLWNDEISDKAVACLPDVADQARRFEVANGGRSAPARKPDYVTPGLIPRR